MYDLFSDILELIPDDKLVLLNTKNEYLVKLIFNFIIKYNINDLALSLSGGVDSMVLFDILDFIKKNIKQELNIILIHLNYNNRKESEDEKNFLIEYSNLKKYNIQCLDFDFKRNDLKRDIYEKESKNIRYVFYKKIVDTFNLQGVFLAHHEDDLTENIFNNLMRGNRDITDITVFKETNIIMDVPIYRPLLDIKKKIIYDYSIKFQIPYFLDTTPDWSCRGKMRNKIFPQCEDCYTHKFKDNLLKLGKESDDLNIIVNEYILNVLIKDIKIDNNNFKIKKEKIVQEKFILKNLLVKIFHKYNLSALKMKIIDSILNNYHKNVKLSMSKDYIVEINEEYIFFVKQ